jgi:hypothetical protein
MALVLPQRGLGILEGVVISCVLLYLILDIRIDLQNRKNDLRLLQELEKRMSLLLR